MLSTITRRFLYLFYVSTAISSAAAVELDLKATHAFLIDYKTDAVLYNQKGDERMGPSSMSKMMTAYLTFSKLKDGSITMDQEFTVSLKAQKAGGSTMFLQAGQKVKVIDLIQGMIVQSGNDACITLAEGISGSEEAFVHLMNETATNLGMKNSTFRNTTGLPDPQHLMSPRDLAILAKALIRDFPEYYHYHQQKEFTFNNITQPNRNVLLGENGVDGIKTGHTETAGYGLTATNQINGRRLIAVINGLNSQRARAEESRKLLAYGYANFNNLLLAKNDQELLTIPVWHGKNNSIALVPHEDIIITMNSSAISQLKTHIEHPSTLFAPLQVNAPAAHLVLSNNEGEFARFPLYPKHIVEQSSWWGKIIYGISYYKDNLLYFVK